MAHALVRERLQAGDLAIDATAGNGHDTSFLAGIVGASGRVFAFDIQEEALANSRRKLSGEGVDGWVTLVNSDHSKMAEVLGDQVGSAGAVMFNLGYLPRGDKSNITRPESTISAIRSALHLIRPGGVVTIVVYVGHPGGAAEAAALDEFISQGLPENTEAICYSQLARVSAPYLIAIRKSAAR